MSGGGVTATQGINQNYVDYDPISVGPGAMYYQNGSTAIGRSMQGAGGSSKGGSFDFTLKFNPNLNIKGLGLQNLLTTEEIMAHIGGMEKIAMDRYQIQQKTMEQGLAGAA